MSTQNMSTEGITNIARALVLGGGIAGMVCAISLAERGVAVNLVDLDPE